METLTSASVAAALNEARRTQDHAHPHAHAFEDMRGHARRAWTVGVLSLAVMGLELAAGYTLNSVALVSDGLHTSTHVGVMATAAFAYGYSERRAGDPRFAFGPGKVVSLAAFASGVGLAVVGLFIALESVERLIRPEPVAFREAAVVAAVSLVVGGVSAVLLHQPPGRGAKGRDLNLWAAYLHMLADVVSSVLALAALVAGAVLGWTALDALVGLVNAGVVAAFAVNLLRQASAPLLDMAPEALADARVRLGDAGASLHLRMWSVAPGEHIALVKASRMDGIGDEVVRALAQTPGVTHVLAELSTGER